MAAKRLFWSIVELIEASINSGNFPVGSRLPPERELAQRFNVSRPTIREAIIALEVRGRVEVKTSSGVYVLASQQSANLLKNINAFEVTQARALVEGEVAALAAASINEQELEDLNQTLIDMEKGKDMEAADRAFHKIIANATRNEAMKSLVESLWNLRASSKEIIEDYDSVCSKDSAKTIAEHRAIYNALKSADADKSRTAMHEHFHRLINTLFDAEETRALEKIKRESSEKRDMYSIKRQA
ncbi:FadR/GntR family transcriptional regulator [Thalassotalea sp. 1_MG-2023]|uniref:FadR/GntR family transcriptional regulator n=1 Tax=Thalassotalea sp. 1_MG-2023 TaxID=3062680 RepID=UPI0026E1F96E|nr:FadR/GntR family transcriptional regulator [Thalassotalea sp. 1_MG-2023]MDO6427579.1 FadR/GntR family transcriptional regulator [Thalassotalea sp. 1_MG-2023]